MIRRRESTIKSRILEEEDDDDENSQDPQNISYIINVYNRISRAKNSKFSKFMSIWDLRNEHKTFIPYASQTYPNRKFSRQYSTRQMSRLEEHTAIMHFFFALSLSFLIWWVLGLYAEVSNYRFLWLINYESYFSAALTYLMLRTMDCETFKNACWAKVQPFKAQPPKKSALGAALKSVQEESTWNTKNLTKK